jgi:tetratricopeptide (TPR) repeat protein
MTRFIVPRINRCHLQWLAVSFVGVSFVLSTGCAGTPSKPNIPTAFATRPLPHESTNSQQQPDSSHPGGRSDGKQPPQPSGNSMLAKSFEEAQTRGDAAWSAGEADMAIYLYIQALSFRPRDIDTLGKIGSIEQSRGNLELAARAFELAANADQSDARLSGRLGLILLGLGNEESARSWLQRSVDTGCTDWRVFDALGVTESHQGHYAAALQYSGEAVALAPGVAVPQLHRGLAMFGSGNYVGAEDAVRTALHLSNLPEGWRLLGQIQAKRHAYPASIDSLLQVMDTPAAYNMAGKLAMDNGDNAVALRYFEKASTASPVYLVEAQRNAAIARERMGAVNQ